VILESIAAFGIEATLARMIGMFAIALWDRHEKTLALFAIASASSRSIGQSSASYFYLARNSKRAHPGWTPRINRNATASFM
jgi:asparagine synthase (glutamine-hydrolysing)